MKPDPLVAGPRLLYREFCAICLRQLLTANWADLPSNDFYTDPWGRFVVCDRCWIETGIGFDYAVEEIIRHRLSN